LKAAANKRILRRPQTAADVGDLRWAEAENASESTERAARSDAQASDVGGALQRKETDYFDPATPSGFTQVVNEALADGGGVSPDRCPPQ
jgi:hypothetical protein